MARYTRIEVTNEILRGGLVPLFYHQDVEVAWGVVEACYRGGCRVVEFTNRGDFAHEVFGALEKRTRDQLPGLILGVGSITDGGTASLYMQLGANFVVSPVLREDVLRVCNRRKVLWIAGCMSAKEIAEAEEWGAEIVKVFPGEGITPNIIKSIKNPCPWSRLMVTGGVADEVKALQGWFDAGADCIGMGSRLIKKEAVQQQNYKIIETKVKQVLNLIQEVKHGHKETT